jgi:hypothetical protein
MYIKLKIQGPSLLPQLLPKVGFSLFCPWFYFSELFSEASAHYNKLFKSNFEELDNFGVSY